MVSLETFPLPDLSKVLEDICIGMYDGCGFAVVRGLDSETYVVTDFTTVYLGLSSYVAERRGSMLRKPFFPLGQGTEKLIAFPVHVTKHDDEGDLDIEYCRYKATSF
jgi:hypothetical protein